MTTAPVVIITKIHLSSGTQGFLGSALEGLGSEGSVKAKEFSM